MPICLPAPGSALMPLLGQMALSVTLSCGVRLDLGSAPESSWASPHLHFPLGDSSTVTTRAHLRIPWVSAVEFHEFQLLRPTGAIPGAAHF
jgi:hypothetical protein